MMDSHSDMNCMSSFTRRQLVVVHNHDHKQLSIQLNNIRSHKNAPLLSLHRDEHHHTYHVIWEQHLHDCQTTVELHIQPTVSDFTPHNWVGDALQARACWSPLLAHKTKYLKEHNSTNSDQIIRVIQPSTRNTTANTHNQAVTCTIVNLFYICVYTAEKIKIPNLKGIERIHYIFRQCAASILRFVHQYVHSCRLGKRFADCLIPPCGGFCFPKPNLNSTD